MAKRFLPLRLAWHELRHGWHQFKAFLACLMLGVAMMGTVHSLGKMVHNGLEKEAQSLLGGDIEVSIRGQEASPEAMAYLQSLGTLSHVVTLRSMLRTAEGTSLVEMKAIDAAYPLLGELLIHQDIAVEKALAENGVIVDETLLEQFSLTIGDQVKIGESDYVINATLKREPDRAVQIFSFGPRVFLSHEALQQSGLINPMSLISYRYRVVLASKPRDMKRFENQLEETLATRFPNFSWRVTTGTDGNQATARFTNQFITFLSLSALSTFLIAGIGIAISVRLYLSSQTNVVAVMKVMGASKVQVSLIFALVLLLLSLIGSAIGVGISLVLLHLALPLLAELIPALLAQSRIAVTPLLMAMWYGVVVSFVFSIPALFSALITRPSQLFRSQVAPLAVRLNRQVFFIMLVLVTILVCSVVLSSYDREFTAAALLLMILCFAVFYLCALGIYWVARRVHPASPLLRLAIGNLHRPGNSTGTTIYAIGISLSILIALILTEANFQTRLDAVVEEEAPSLFMFDIQPFQKDDLAKAVAPYVVAGTIKQPPMIRGRITHKNGQPLTEENVDDDVRWAIRGDRGLSYSKDMPENGYIVAGTWWPPEYQGEPLVSVDSRFLKGMGLALGDVLTLNVMGEAIGTRVTSARKIDYSSFQINFALVLSPGVLEAFPHSYLTTLTLKNPKKNEAAVVKQLTEAFPNITIIRTTEVVEVVRNLLENIAIALRITVAISLFAGIFVLMSSLAATLEQRLYDIAVLKILGAKKYFVMGACLVEWGILSVITCAVASVIGTVSSYLLLKALRFQSFAIMPEVTFIIICVCFLVIAVIGYIGNLRLFHFRPAALLRNE